MDNILQSFGFKQTLGNKVMADAEDAEALVSFIRTLMIRASNTNNHSMARAALRNRARLANANRRVTRGSDCW